MTYFVECFDYIGYNCYIDKKRRNHDENFRHTGTITEIQSK